MGLPTVKQSKVKLKCCKCHQEESLSPLAKIEESLLTRIPKPDFRTQIEEKEEEEAIVIGSNAAAALPMCCHTCACRLCVCQPALITF